MNIAQFSIEKNVITWMVTIGLTVAGVISFGKLSRLEDPAFTIKEAVVVTPYPGASTAEVEEEVTDRIERAIQQLGQLDKLESRSEQGLSIVQVYIKDQYGKDALPQVWDELRRKVGDAQRELPPGAGPSIVNDDFGDVYGVYYALTGDGYTMAELQEVAEFLQRELLLVQDVKRVTFYAAQQEVVWIEMRREIMAQLGVSPADIQSALAAKNVVTPAGEARFGAQRVEVRPTGELTSEAQLADLLISVRGTDSLVRLGDVAEIRRGYADPPGNLLRFDGRPAIGIGISTVEGGNAVTMGEGVEKRLAELESEIPLGMELGIVSMQSQAVTKAIRSFVVSLAEAIAIVIIVLLFAMGLRSGLIIGGVLAVTICGTFLIMDLQDVTLERISLGALVIALGMLVDNAIVVTDGMRVKMANGEDPLAAAKAVVGQTALPLLGATVVAVAAFAGIGLSQDNTGEYCRTLFQVILISLVLSWVIAVTTTPLVCTLFLKRGTGGGTQEKEALIVRVYRAFLAACLRRRWVATAVVIVLFGSSLVGFGKLKGSFFPASTRPQFYVDFWFPADMRIEDLANRLEPVEDHLTGLDGVTHVTTLVGGGQVRFLLTYPTEKAAQNFGQILVDVEDYRIVPDLLPIVQRELEQICPEALVNARQFVNGPATGGKIQVRVLGDDTATLRTLGRRARDILEADPQAKAVRNESGERVKVLRPVLAEAPARHAGLTRPQVAAALEAAFSGTPAGVYREGDELLPILIRSPEPERLDLDSLRSIQVWSPTAGAMIPLGQVVSGFETVFDDAYIWRFNRQRMIRISADEAYGLPSEILGRVKAPIEAAVGVDLARVVGREVPASEHDATTVKVVRSDRLPLRDHAGYAMAWGGEIESSAKAQAALAGQMPAILCIMIAIVIALFNSVRKAVVIWLCVPLAMIGVTAGLLLFKQPFGFMALLGLLSLSGMLIKNAIVLLDEIGVQLSGGKEPFLAVLDSGVARLVPVSMAAATTILGMLPLLQDAFFVSMAVTIMFGLGFATVLTLVIVPVFYVIIFRIPAVAKR